MTNTINETPLRNALDKLAIQRTIDSERLNPNVGKFITNSLITEIKLINRMNPVTEVYIKAVKDLDKLCSSDIDGHITLLGKVIDNILTYLTSTVEEVADALTFFLPVESAKMDYQL